MKANYFSTSDVTYAYTVNGVGEVLLLFHGFTGSSKTWEAVIPFWSEKYQVIALDMPGHGETKCSSPITMETFSHDVRKLLLHLQIDRCHLLGYSMGGRAALSFAMYHPDIVQSLILESASPGLQTEKERTDRIKHDAMLAHKIKIKGVPSFVSYWENIPLFATQKKLPKHIQEKIRNERLAQSALGLADSLLYMGTGKQPSWWEQLKALTVPVLLLVGEEDEKFVQLNKKMQKAIQDVQLTIFKNAGHAIHVEQGEKFAKIVREFLENK